MKRQKIYVMFGYKLDDIEQTAFFGHDLKLVEDIDKARRFIMPRQKTTGTPQDWLELINSDADINHGYKFHLVSVIR